METEGPHVLVLVSAVVVALACSGCIMPHDGDHDGPPAPPPQVNIEQGRTEQSELTLWDTRFTLTLTQDAGEYWLRDVTLEFSDQEEDQLPRPTINYMDNDLDQLVSSDDVIVVEGMTDEYQGGRLRMSCGEEHLGTTQISWDVEDFRIYTLVFYWFYPAVENDTRWDTYFKLTHCKTELPMGVENLSYAVEGEDSRMLEAADIVYKDTDGDGLVSLWDQLWLYGMTGEYQGGRVRVQYNGGVVGLADLPDFIPKP